MLIKQIQFQSLEYALALALRQKILREPLGLHYTIESLQHENVQWHFVAINSDFIVGNCILQKINHNTVKLRQMCVESKFQQKNIGKRLVQYVETFAAQNHYDNIILHARENAIPFYLKLNYIVYGESFQEVGLPHFAMKKQIFKKDNQ